MRASSPFIRNPTVSGMPVSARRSHRPKTPHEIDQELFQTVPAFPDFTLGHGPEPHTSQAEGTINLTEWH